MEWDEAQHLPLEIFPQLAELGLLGIIFPEEYGGAVYIAAHKTQAARLALRF
jgi:alkylation response protein AidB-like acyl-CoA dehydrogenase